MMKTVVFAVFCLTIRSPIASQLRPGLCAMHSTCALARLRIEPARGLTPMLARGSKSESRLVKPRHGSFSLATVPLHARWRCERRWVSDRAGNRLRQRYERREGRGGWQTVRANGDAGQVVLHKRTMMLYSIAMGEPS